MMRSMYAGISGLKNHQIRMDIIGNNIANVNTAGYKKSRVVFKDSLYQNIQGASRPTGARGGTNPMSVGLGMSVASIDQIHTPSPAATTNKTSDLAVDGSGYFIVENGGQLFYTRAGAFDFDTMGNYVNNSNGFRVHGWMADENGEISTVKATQPIDISGFKTVNPHATTEMRFAGNLDSNLDIPMVGTPAAPIDPTNGDQHPGETESVIVSKEVYDSLGNKHEVYFRFFRTGVNAGPPSTSDWACDITVDEPGFENMAGYASGTDFESVDLLTSNAPGSDVRLIRVRNLRFDDQGRIADPAHALINLTIPGAVAGADDIEFEVDFSQITQWDVESDAEPTYQDGYTMGSLTGYAVGLDGTIQGVYNNGTYKNIARVALANFQNPSGLLQAGGSLYQVSNNSGDPLVGGPGDKGMGAVLPSRLEMSNVDLSEEFTDMIVTQRGFQANSRIITTSDEMLQELVNLKR